MLSDTTPETERTVLELRRAQTPGERMSAAIRMTELAQSFEIGMLKKQYPDATEEEFRFLLTKKRYGLEMAEKAFGKGAG